MVKISSREESTIDYPGKMGQILFVSGCNFRCGFCHNPELVLGQMNEINLEKLLTDIGTKAKSGWYSGVTISGGEPTIYPDLPEFIKKLKDLGLSVKLDTNGTNPNMLRRLLKSNLVDYVAMDIKAPRKEYSHIVHSSVDTEDIDRSIGIVKLFPEYEFRTTVLPYFTNKDIESIGAWACFGRETDKELRECYKKVKLFTLQQYNPKKTLDPDYSSLSPKQKSELDEMGKLMEKYSEKVRVLG